MHKLMHYMLKNTYGTKWMHLPVGSESPVDYQSCYFHSLGADLVVETFAVVVVVVVATRVKLEAELTELVVVVEAEMTSLHYWVSLYQGTGHYCYHHQTRPLFAVKGLSWSSDDVSSRLQLLIHLHWGTKKQSKKWSI